MINDEHAITLFQSKYVNADSADKRRLREGGPTSRNDLVLLLGGNGSVWQAKTLMNGTYALAGGKGTSVVLLPG